MSYYENLSRKLQSRVRKNGNHIALVECWKKSYHALGRMKDFRATKEELQELRAQQVLDKALLKLTQDLAHEERLHAEWMELLLRDAA